MQVERSIEINATRDAVWEVIGPGFADAYKWASAVDHSTPSKGTHEFPSAPNTGRTCTTSIGNVRENVLTYDEDSKQISYEAFSDGMPGFVKRLVASWRFSKGGSNAVRVHMKLTVEIAPPFNILMGPMMKLKMGGILSDTMKDLKHFVETGKQSPLKVKAAAKYQKKSGRSVAA